MSPEFECGYRTAIEYMERLSFSTHWVYTSDRMPDREWEEERSTNSIFDPEFLVLIKNATITTTLRYNGREFVDYDETAYEVVCWAPMPPAPDLSWRDAPIDDIEIEEDELGSFLISHEMKNM